PDFQEGLRNYRDLKLMQSMLGQWLTGADAFQEMIAARHTAYAQRVPKVDGLLTSGKLAALGQRRAALAARLEQVERAHEVTALAAPDESALWARVERVQAKLAHDPDTPTYAKLRERLTLVRGVLLYKMDQEFAARLWQERRQLKRLDLSLSQAQERWGLLESGRQTLPVQTGDFAARVTMLQQRIGTLQVRLAAADSVYNEAAATEIYTLSLHDDLL